MGLRGRKISGDVSRWVRGRVKRWLSEYSQAMLGQIIEIVNTLIGSQYLGIGHKAACAQGVSDRWKSKPAPGQARTHVGLPKRTESTCPSTALTRHVDYFRVARDPGTIADQRCFTRELGSRGKAE